MRKFENLSKGNQKDWIKAIKSFKNFDDGIAIISYLKWNFKKDISVDLPCYTSPDIQDEFRTKLWKICKKKKTTNEDLDIVKILAPLVENASAEKGCTPIHWAAGNGHKEIVKILAPLTDNPIAPNKYGVTPIHEAASEGHTEIVKILAPLTDNPNAASRWNGTPLSVAKNIEIKEILKTYLN